MLKNNTLKIFKYLILPTIITSKILATEISTEELSKIIVLSNKLTNTNQITKFEQINDPQDLDAKNKNIKLEQEDSNIANQKTKLEQENNSLNTNIINPESELTTILVSTDNQQDNTTITKAGGTVTTSNDFVAINRLVKTANTTTQVSDSGITIDNYNNMSGVNSLTVPAGSTSAPSIVFPGVGTNTGFYSPSSDIIGVSAQGSNIATISNAGVALNANKTFYVNSPCTVNNSSQFNNPVTLNGSTTFNAPTTFATGTTTFDGTTTIYGPATLSGTNTISGAINSSSTLSIPNGGSASSPAIKFNGLANTGIYSSTNNVSVSTDGAQRINFATGAVTIPANNILTVPAGSAASPSIQFSGSTNTGLSCQTANTISFDTSATERANISSSSLSMSVPINMNNNNISNANTITASTINASGINVTGVNFSGNVSLNSGSNLNASQTGFTRICPTQFTVTNGSLADLSASSNSTNYDVFYINGNSITSAQLVVGKNFPVGTLKAIVNGSTAGQSFIGYAATGAFKNVAGQSYNSYPLSVYCGHGAILMCTDSENGYWTPIAQ